MENDKAIERLKQIAESVVNYKTSSLHKEWKDYIEKTPSGDQLDFYIWQALQAKYAIEALQQSEPDCQGEVSKFVKECREEIAKTRSPLRTPTEITVFDYADKLEQALSMLEKQEKQLEDIKLELSCPETMGMDKNPLYEWAAVVQCEKLRLKGVFEKYGDHTYACMEAQNQDGPEDAHCSCGYEQALKESLK